MFQNKLVTIFFSVHLSIQLKFYINKSIQGGIFPVIE